MSLPHILIGLLKYKPNTGYNIKTAFESSINFFWDVSLPQIYRTLNTMEKRGWLEATIEHQEGKPSKKTYQVTSDGDRQFQAWLQDKVMDVKAKDELLVKLFFGGFMDRDILIRHINERRQQAVRFLEKADEKIAPSVSEYASKASAPDDTVYWLLTLDYGRRRAQMTLEWCDNALKILEKGK